MKELIIVSENLGKIKEYQDKLKPIKCIPYQSLLNISSIEETGQTFKENAYIKAKAVFDQINRPCIGDDSGLIVDALPNQLGVHSKRFSKQATTEANNKLLLEKLKGIDNRKASFHTVICLLVPDQEPRFYEGSLHGHITLQARGQSGFGYDPLFEIPSTHKTLAELTLEEKNALSHRARAIEKLMEDLNNETHRLL
jgi:XTP/dITP diphosphohydrolase